MTVELALGPKDRDKFGGPEWVAFDVNKLDEVPFEELDALERQMMTVWGMGLTRLISHEMPENTLRAKRALVWLGRKLTGVETPELAKFTIDTSLIRVRQVKPVGDVDPPEVDSSSTSLEEEKFATASTSSSPGSGKTRATNSRRAKSGS